ncbi:glycogen synthase GlgA [Fuchsiella alkaliacetigena]|uniref:glycogen synthase GlgA n=1 Tax=Fuchsiella alkaliacetigena TaxID=957042 RepID=UPI0027E2ADE5|nr:glycogen synthase GlgA [Fuchsiella alkaliacetigena]
MKVLFLASEVAPFIKTGGLADVAGSLPQALADLGVDIRVAMPQYSQIDDNYLVDLEHLLHFRTKVAWRNNYVGVNKLDNNGVTTYFIDNINYFDRDNIYDDWDRHIQYTYFCRAVLEMLPKLDFKPDIIHCNDWQTGPISLMLKDNYQQYDFYQDIKTVFTIHNLKYQGQFAPEALEDVLCLDSAHWESGVLKHEGAVNYMKMGINMSDLVSTVSRTYAREIQTAEYGEGLDYALRMNADDLYGIINGIDYQQYDPATDELIAANYSAENISAKYENKKRLQEEMGLAVKDEVPVISLISRLVEQKGLDLLLEVADELLQRDIQLVILGTGEKYYENALRDLGSRYPERLAVNIKYDTQLARKIYAGSDIFLMPSKFEPCGLSQLLSLRYGTIPVVRETGGLKDTITPYNEFTDEGNGFSFSNYNAGDMLYTIERALDFYHQNGTWEKLVKRAMKSDYSWESSARKYQQLYWQLSDVNGSKIEINQAGVEELQKLKGIGPALAKRIIEYRQAQGGFDSVAELKEVSGIGSSTFATLADSVFVEIESVEKVEESYQVETELSETQVSIADLYQLPDAYADNRMVFQARNPYSAHVYWEYTTELVDRVISSLKYNSLAEAELSLRLYDLTIGAEYNVYYDTEIGVGDDNWYFFDLEPEHTYLVRLGILDEEGEFHIILESNKVLTPRDSISDLLDEEWLRVEEKESLARIYRLSISEESGSLKDGTLKESYGSLDIQKSYASLDALKVEDRLAKLKISNYSSLSLLEREQEYSSSTVAEEKNDI